MRTRRPRVVTSQASRARLASATDRLPSRATLLGSFRRNRRQEAEGALQLLVRAEDVDQA